MWPPITLLAVATSISVSFYSFYLLTLVLFDLRRRPDVDPPCDEHPVVTVQIPVYNETLVQRALKHVVALDYPRDRLQIQVLDDSTDPAVLALERRLVARYRRRGFDVTLVHRDHRTGYKAGALNHGLATARGEYVLIVDTDTIVPRHFLRYVLPNFFEDPQLAFAQSRCDYANRWFNLVTEANAMTMDVTYNIELPARYHSDLIITFAGQAGIWRRAVLDRYGWDESCLTEDIEISYRTQIDGWKALYLADIACEMELPPQLSSLKRQQARWIAGCVQSLKKHFRPILRSATLSRLQKADALLFLSSPVVYPVSVLAILLWIGSAVYAPVVTTNLWLDSPVIGAFLTLSSIGPVLSGVVASLRGNRDGHLLRKLAAIPLTIVLVTASLLSNAKAAVQGLFKTNLTFQVTRKFGLTNRSARRRLPVESRLARVRANALELIASGLVSVVAGVLLAAGQLTSVLPLLFLISCWLIGTV